MALLNLDILHLSSLSTRGGTLANAQTIVLAPADALASRNAVHGEHHHGEPAKNTQLLVSIIAVWPYACPVLVMYLSYHGALPYNWIYDDILALSHTDYCLLTR